MTVAIFVQHLLNVAVQVDACKNAMKECHEMRGMDVWCTCPRAIPLATDHKKLPARLLVWVWGSTPVAFGRKGVQL